MNEPGAAERVSLFALLKVFLMAGAISFGGGVIAYLREYFVNQQRWLDDDTFLEALEMSETLPGLNSVNMSVIVGDRLRGAIGSLVAVIGLTLPGAVMVLVMGALWEDQRHNPHLIAFLLGVAAAAVGLLTVVTLQLGRRQFTSFPDVIFVLVTFAAVSLLKFSLIVVLVVLGPIAVWCFRPKKGSAAGVRAEPLAHRRLLGRRRGALRH